MELIIFILIVYGLANIIVNESIFRKIILKIRSLNTFFDGLFSCTTCLSFWIGVGLYMVMPLELSGIFYVDILLAGFLSSGSVNLIEYIKNIMI